MQARPHLLAETLRRKIHAARTVLGYRQSKGRHVVTCLEAFTGRWSSIVCCTSVSTVQQINFFVLIFPDRFRLWWFCSLEFSTAHDMRWCHRRIQLWGQGGDCARGGGGVLGTCSPPPPEILRFQVLFPAIIDTFQAKLKALDGWIGHAFHDILSSLITSNYKSHTTTWHSTTHYTTGHSPDITYYHLAQSRHRILPLGIVQTSHTTTWNSPDNVYFTNLTLLSTKISSSRILRNCSIYCNFKFNYFLGRLGA